MKQLLRYLLSTLLITVAVFVAMSYLMLGPNDEAAHARADLQFKPELSEHPQPVQKARANRNKQTKARATRRKESGSSAVQDRPVESPAVPDRPVESPAVPDRPVESPAVPDRPVESPAIPDMPVAWTAIVDRPVASPAILDTQEASPAIPDEPEARPAVPNWYDALPQVAKKSLTQPEVQAPAVTNGKNQDPDTVLRLAPAESPPAQTRPPYESPSPLPPCVLGCGLPGTGLLTTALLTPTVLYSFPGSGVVAFKRLLTTATQVVTGTIYDRTERDIYISRARLYRVILGRTSLTPKVTSKYVDWKRMVLFIRNPYEAMVMQFMRDEFSDDDSPLDPSMELPSGWPKYVDEQTAIFKDMYLAWAKDRKPKHVVIYDRLVNNVRRELNSALEFLREPPDSGINPTVHCAEADAAEILPATAVPGWLSERLRFVGKHVTALNAAIDAVRAAVEASAKAKFPEFERWKRV